MDRRRAYSLMKKERSQHHSGTTRQRYLVRPPAIGHWPAGAIVTKRIVPGVGLRCSGRWHHCGPAREGIELKDSNQSGPLALLSL